MNLRKLCTKDKNGLVPMSELFDMVYSEIQGEEAISQLSDFVACEYNKSSAQFKVFDSREKLYTLTVYKDGELSFWWEGQPLHFNQAPVYAYLYNNGFLKVKEGGNK